MNALRDNYTQLEWLQMGVFLIGLPIAAVVGALFGLVGKWNQGRVMTAALVGLGGAAFTSIVLFLVFITIDVAGPRLSGGVLLMFFDTYMSWRYTTIAVIATGALSLLGAIGFRARDSKQAVYSVSMRQILLLQVYAFIALGCWSGMRFFALSKFSGYQRAQHQWGKQEWMVLGDNSRGPIGLERNFANSRQLDWNRENAALLVALAEPWLRELHLYELNSSSAIEMKALADGKQLESLALQYSATTLAPQSHIEVLGNCKSLQGLYICGGDFRDLNLSPLTRSKSLKHLSVRDAIFDEDKLKQAIKTLNLPQFEVQLTPATFLVRPRAVTVVGGDYKVFTELNAGAVELDWINPKQITKLMIQARELNLEGAKRIAEMEKLDEIELYCQIEAPALEEIAAHSRARRILLELRSTPRDEEGFKRAYANLLRRPSLLVLDFLSGVSRPVFVSGNSGQRSMNWGLEFRDSEFFNEERRKLGLNEILINPDLATRRRVLERAPGVD